MCLRPVISRTGHRQLRPSSSRVVDSTADGGTADGDRAHPRWAKNASAKFIDGATVDSLGMWGATTGLPEQLQAAVAAPEPARWCPPARPIGSVVVVGTGGSGIVADLVAAIGGKVMPVPVMAVRSGEIPVHVGPDSLVLAVSFSGNTPETVSAAKAAYDTGATVITVAGGGQLATLAEEHEGTMFVVPESIPQSRAALGALAVPTFVALEELGLFDGALHELQAAVELLLRRRDELVAAGGPAEVVASRIGRTMPLIYGANGPAAVAARRWKTQINLNAKSAAFWSSQPELCHDEIAGWGQGGDVTRQVLTVVTLRHDGEQSDVARRFNLVDELLREVVADVIEVRTPGTQDLQRFFDLAYFGDVVSLFLAAREGIDPGPVPILSGVASAPGIGSDAVGSGQPLAGSESGGTGCATK